MRREITDLTKWYYPIAVFRVMNTNHASCSHLITASWKIVQKREADRIADHRLVLSYGYWDTTVETLL